jgi:4-amino-4-deoxy-L-arabinose transferase-like glycosyltransferase
MTVSRTDRRLAAGLAGLALGLRLLVVVATAHSYRPINDPVDFLRIATSIWRGQGFGPTTHPFIHGPSAFRTPLYPYFLAMVFVATGPSVTAGRLATAVVSALFAVSLGALGWRLGGRRVGLVVLAGAAVYPPFLLAGYGLEYEPLLLLFMTTALIVGIEWRARPERRWLLPVCGLLVGFGVLCRETAAVVLLPPAWFVVASTWRVSRRRAAGLLAVLVVPAILVVAPWTIRNAIELHAFIPVSDSPSEALAGAYNATAAADKPLLGVWSTPYADPTDLRAVEALGSGANEAQVTSLLGQLGRRYAEQHPAFVAKLFAWNTVRLLDLRGFRDALFTARYAPLSATLTKASVIAWWVLLPLAVAGIFTAARRRVPGVIWLVPAVIYILLALTVGDIQYRVTIEPFVVILAAMALVTAWDRLVPVGMACGGRRQHAK